MAEIPFPSPPLGDDVVLLRPWRETDVPSLLDAFSDPFFLYFSDWAPATEADAYSCLVEYESVRKRGDQVQLALVEPRDVDASGAAYNASTERARRSGNCM